MFTIKSEEIYCNMGAYFVVAIVQVFYTMLCHFLALFPYLGIILSKGIFQQFIFHRFFFLIFSSTFSDGLILSRSEGKFINLNKKNLIFVHNSLYIKPFL